MLKSSPTLGEYLPLWLSSYCENRLARNTINGYRNNIYRHILPVLGSVRLCDLAPYDLDRLYALLREKGLSGTSILYVHATLRKAMNTAMRRRLIAENVVECVDPPKKNDFTGRFLTVPELQTLLDSCRYRESYIPVLLASVLGLRRGEVLGLSWDNVNLDGRYLDVVHSATCYKGEYVIAGVKTSSSRRRLLLPGIVVNALASWNEVQTKPSYQNLVVTRFDGSPMTSGSLNSIFKKSLHDADLPDIRFHDLHHTYATVMLQNNIAPKIVCDIMGHSSIDVTMDIYSHVLTSMQQPAADAVDHLFR